MKKLILALACIVLTVGCRQDSGTRNTPGLGPKPSQPETLLPGAPIGRSQNNNGGGIDSSGGDLLTSSDTEVDAALENIDDKVFDVAFRLGYELSSAEKTDFEMKFGENSYALTRDLFTNKGPLNKNIIPALKEKLIRFNLMTAPCEGDHQDRAGSARWNGNTPEICLSRSLLRKMSPESLQIDVLALAMHEVSHLYGYDEAKAQAIQSFVLRNKGLLWPHQDQIKDAVENADELLGLFANLALQYRAKNNLKMCSSIELMLKDALLIHKNRENTKSVVLPNFVVHQLKNLPMVLGEITVSCDKGESDQVRATVAKNLLEIYTQIASVNRAVRTFANPTRPGDFFPTLDYLNIMAIFEEESIVKAIAPKADAQARVEMEDVSCKIQTFDNQIPDKAIYNATYSVKQFHGDKSKGLGSINYTSNGESPFMFRRTEGQRALGFGFMSKTYTVTTARHMMPTNGGGDLTHSIFASALIPGINENFQFEATDGVLTIRVRCGIKIKGKAPDLEYVVDTKPVPSSKDINDDYFIAKPKSTILLRVRLNKQGQPQVAGGPELKAEAIERIRFNGHIILNSKNENCIISGFDLENRKIDAKKLASELRDGKYKEVICDMNGSLLPDGRASHAPSSFDFKVQ